MINLPRSIESIVAELFDPFMYGIMSIEDVLKKRDIRQISTEIKKIENSFIHAPYQDGPVTQDRYRLLLGSADGALEQPNLPTINKLTAAYIDFYSQMSELSNFKDLPVNSITINKYLPGSIGVSAHFDPYKFKNMIAVFTIKGCAPFYFCYDREGKQKIEFGASVGSLLLIRAPRDKTEKSMRPMHYLGRVLEDRYSIGYRAIRPLDKIVRNNPYAP